MGLTRLVFDDEESYRKARDINIEMRLAEGWVPDPSLDMLINDERIDAVKQRLDAEGVEYKVEPDA